MDQNPERRRGHFHRGRRGPDRRGPDRRTPPAQEAAGRDQVDVEQIMRDIRARIAQRHGIELSTQQIEELAARRLESILDPHNVNPALVAELRRSAGAGAERAEPRGPVEAPYTFEDTTLYESHRGLLRFIRRVLNPVLKLFFNPNPLIRALNIQARLNTEAAEREAERDRRQSEWNALHYEIVQRLVTEVSRLSLELQAQSMRVESLAARVDFNDRRVRGIEGAVHQSRPPGRPEEAAPSPGGPPSEVAATENAAEGVPSESSRRRRRRRRGRRSGPPGEATHAVPPGAAPGTLEAESDASEGEPESTEDEQGEPAAADEPVTAASQALVEQEPRATAPEAAHPAVPIAAPDEAAAPPAVPASPPDSGQRDQ